MGFIILNALNRALAEAGLSTQPAVIVSRTLVDPDDPAFQHPTKPIGRYTDSETASRMMRIGQSWADFGDKGWRRVVPSPKPQRIVDSTAIGALLDAGCLVVGGGGGGIPVIDKDLNSVLLASQIDADALVLATNVDNAWIDFGKDSARPLGQVDLATMRSLEADGQFAPGSMLPKVQAVCTFVERTGGRGVITSLGRITEALEGGAGTVVVP